MLKIMRPLRRARLYVALLLLLGMMSAESIATPLQTQMIVEPAADAYIQSNMPNVNFGSRDALELGYMSGAERRLLIRFDLSELAGNIEIESAELLLRVTVYPDEAFEAVPVEVHRVLSPWEEGDGIGSSTAPGNKGVTWLQPDRAADNVNWIVPGAGGDGSDRTAEPGDVADVRDKERLVVLPGIPARFLVLDVTKDVQQYHRDGTPNHGWLLSIPSDTPTRLRFNSKDAGEDARHPRLRITYREVDTHP